MRYLTNKYFSFALLCFCHCLVSAQGLSDFKIKSNATPTQWTKQILKGNILPEYPRPQMSRKNNWQNLNGLWQYIITEKEASIPDKFDGHILVPFPVESSLSGIKRKLLPNELLWYKKSFEFGGLKNGQRLLLHFGAVDWRATVYVNGNNVGEHTGGYTAFSIDITNYLKIGENVLIVKVYDPSDKGIGPHGKQVLNPGNIYYTPSSGIWQTVWLEQVPATYIRRLIQTPDFDNGIIKVAVDIEGSHSPVEIEVSATTENGETYTSKGLSTHIIPLKIKHVRPWTPDDPFLYDLKVIVTKNGQKLDEVSSYFGMRKIETRKDSSGYYRIFLNNKYTYNLGVLDQGFWPDGLYTAPTDSALMFDISMIKAMGFNTIRKHIKIEPARWYYHADRIGVLVWQDFVNPNQRLPEGSKSEFERQVSETIGQLYNFPCIITWVLFNERWGAYDQQRLTEYVKKQDPTRLVNGHSGELLYVNNILRDTASNPYVSSDMADIHSYPFPRNAPSLNGKAKVLGEFGGIGVPVEGHIWNDLIAGWGYNGMGTPQLLKLQYAQMIDSLLILEKKGLTASIYTQPFDVESEQNGLLTYDRTVIKIPLNLIQSLNAKVLPLLSFKYSNNLTKNIQVADTTVVTYEKRTELYKSGSCDSACLRSLSIMAFTKKDTSLSKLVSAQYIEGIKDKFSETNLRYIINFTLTTNDPGFSILFNNRKTINAVLGENASENAILNILFKDKIEPHLKDSIVDWNRIESDLLPYGDLAEEKISSSKLLYYFGKSDWDNFGKYYKIYFEKVLKYKRNNLHINNLSWPIFEHITDRDILEVAVRVMKFNIDNYDANNVNAIDTYANLLYKTGKKDEAITWQLKAIKMSKNNEEFRSNYEKMMKNQKTWD
ncbi:glycoside hydrolase family 2 [Chitinophaga polysaccharea]|uniref:glycoside hydrolase family 2 protein n=1 Tax=Chitinophaga polysaccharea TaxID=1293035 RepID=UPI001455D6A7|nr:sugar-binding domain-containing protein [Chitinophaga polysaccharea]NLR60707.1 glycoside hydrolase family 2 [Chitinophaga polysaccharea]